MQGLLGAGRLNMVPAWAMRAMTPLYPNPLALQPGKNFVYRFS